MGALSGLAGSLQKSCAAARLLPPTSCPAAFPVLGRSSREGCSTCDQDATACDKDNSCLDGYGPGDTPGTCKPCAVGNCTSCGGSYKLCTGCRTGFRFDAPADQCQGGSGLHGRSELVQGPLRSAGMGLRCQRCRSARA